MEDDDLETTMRHGLQELANDAPRGDGLWNTTTSMIAIRADQEPPGTGTPAVAEPKPAPERAQPSGENGRNTLLLGIVIGIAVALLIAVVVLAVLLATSRSSSHAGAATSPATNVSLPAELSKPDAPTTAIMPSGPIPADDVVFNDDTTARIVVADTHNFSEVGLIVPDSNATWTALGVSTDRAHLFVAKTSGVNGCKEAWDLDLDSHALHALVLNADVVAISPDAKKAIVRWDGNCATAAGQPGGQVAIRDIASGNDTVLNDLPTSLADEAAWSPDGSRVAIMPAGAQHVVVYDGAGGIVGQLDRPALGQPVVGWTSSGLLLVDLGLDKTAIVRRYDPGTGQPIQPPFVHVPQVQNDGDHGALVTPTVTAIHEVEGRTYIEIAGSTPTSSYAQLRVVDSGRVPVAVNGWFGREVVG